ncbi:hypothetical protein SNEBB_001045 [Seison nebaliae]|nr:hypothetical protein SNEBB_001045 [Seison nebaliae]
MHSMLSIDEQKRVSNLLDEGTLKDQKENSQSEESGMTSILKSFFPTLSDESENLEDEIDISSIIPTHILKLLKNMDFVQNWMKKEMELDTQFSSLPSFIQYMVGELRKDLANVKEHLLDYCIVGYLYFLMQLAKSYSTRVFKLHRLPPQFKNNSVLSEFLMKQFIVKSDNGKQGQMMKNERETLISHILILVLYLEGFDFNIRKIHSDLHIRIDELTGIARSLHCTVAEETVVHDGNTEFAHRLRLTVKNVLNDKFLSSGPFRRSKKRRN